MILTSFFFTAISFISFNYLIHFNYCFGHEKSILKIIGIIYFNKSMGY